MERNRIEAKVDLFRPLLLETIKPISLLKHLTFLSLDEKNQIEDIKKKEGSGKATSKLLDVIAQKHDVKGKWKLFIGALENDDFDSVAKCLFDSSVIDCPKLRKLINVLSRVVAIHLDPIKLLNDLRSNNLITKQDAEEIEAEGACKGRVASIIVMLDRIPRRTGTWYSVFLRILHDSGQTELVNEIDEDFSDGGYHNVTPERPTAGNSHPLLLNLKHYGSDRMRNTLMCDQGSNSPDRIDFSTCLPPNRNIPALSEPGLLLKMPAPRHDSGTEIASSNSKSSNTTPNRSSRRLLTVKDLQDAFAKINFTPTPIRTHNTNTFKNADLLLMQEVPLKRKIMRAERSTSPSSHDPLEELTSVKTVVGSSSLMNNNTNETPLPVDQNSARGQRSLNSSITDNNIDSFRQFDSITNNVPMGLEKSGASSVDRVSGLYSEDTKPMSVYTSDQNPDFNCLDRQRQITSHLARRDGESNMQRMTSVTEEQLERRYRLIAENRREVMPDGLGLNINDGQESVIDNCDDQERSFSDDDDEDDSDDDDETSISPQEVEEIELRGYQKELVAPGLEGKNCMVVAPTGSGKTRVALKIMQEHIKERRNRRNPKIIFLVEQSALAEQQAKECEKYFGSQVKVITGGIQQKEKFQEIAGWLERRSILVVTAQLLLNALNNEDINITQFTLLVFDECHHTNINHAFNKIMHAYLELKLSQNFDRSRLPQVIGLTASVGVGKATKRDKAVLWIQKMMAHLDAEEIVTVQENIHDLRQYAKEAKQKTIKTPPRSSQLFRVIVTDSMMKHVEMKIRTSHHAKQIPGSQSVLNPPVRKHGDEYTQWLSKLKKQTKLLEDDEARRYIIACLDYLDKFHKCLIIYEDARVKDAMRLLTHEIHKINEHARKNEIEQWLENVFLEYQDVLEQCQHSDEQHNPKLEKLKSLLVDRYKKNNDSRFLIFIKTRDLVDAVHNWMMETPELKGLNPRKFVGAQASVQRGGMTRNEQVDALALFRDGGHKVIIATSVAEEGLDISKCNLVLRYDYVTNEIARVQVRGRARAENSECILLAGAGGMSAQREELNEMKESMMLRAIQKLQQMIRLDKRAVMMEIRNIQTEEFDKRDLQATKDNEKMTQNERIFALLCICGKKICYSFDIKLIQNAHHAIVDPEIMQVIEAKRTFAAKYSDQHIQAGVGIICCKQCMRSLGNVSIYNGTQFPILKIESVVIVDTESDERYAKKSWKQAPFIAYSLTAEDLKIWRKSPTCQKILPMI